MLLLAVGACSTAERPAPAGDPVTAGAPRVTHTDLRGSAAVLEYRLYLPVSDVAERGRAAPLLVMLHGCLQDAASFSAATHMLQHAVGIAVLFPEQPVASNPQQCWNWFNPASQQRGAGEAARLAGVTQHVIAEYGLDESRVWIAGISAGGMMAAIMAASYPDIYIALGVHSAGAFPVASTMAEALAVMRGDALDDATATVSADAAWRAMGPRARSMPVVIVHGSDDAVVNVLNAEQAAQSWWRVHGLATGTAADAHVVRRTGSEGGRDYVVETYATSPDVAPVIERWLIDGLGHAWSGGVAGGSYADPAGPDAARIILDFLTRQRRP